MKTAALRAPTAQNVQASVHVTIMPRVVLKTGHVTAWMAGLECRA